MPTKLAFGALLLGACYYLCYRWLSLPLWDPSSGSLPSFLFVYAFTLLVPALYRDNTTRPGAHWLCLAVAVEPFAGTPALADAVAAILGYFTALATCRLYPAGSAASVVQRGRPWLLALAPVLLAGSYIEPLKPDATPVYMSYSELRQAVAAEAPRAMSSLGRMVIYRDHLFINEANKGLHVIDNTDPRSPNPLGFINIPGNTDVSIRDGYLYADSFVDLVVIDIRDPDQITEVNRQVDVFPYDKYQVVGDDYWFVADPDRGVVIDLKMRN